MVIADGLFAFLSEQVIVGVFRRITEHFKSGELAFNDYGHIGWFSRLAVRLARSRCSARLVRSGAIRASKTRGCRRRGIRG
ncbi:hypothetical protein MINTM019_31570 [Mycobacterium paraintracellulare]|nr:hypothetical protein MINTM019_31570 [Mycobacterium paraintracellulare]BCP10835.1 hypothetical protein MINTM020_29330 [Mycobacterium paraintracellulare]